MVAISNVNFAYAAEVEQSLENYFIDLGVLGRIASGRKWLVTGRKGAGKTAIFKMCRRRGLTQNYRAVEFEGFPWEVFKLLKSSSMLSADSYVATWRFFFLVQIFSVWAATVLPAATDAKKVLEQIYGKTDITALDTFFNRLRQLRKLRLPSVTLKGVDLGEVEFSDEEIRENARLLSSSMHQAVDEMMIVYRRHARNCPVTIYIDSLDNAWESSEESKLLLIGCIKAAFSINEISRSVAPSERPGSIVVFLRSDIYEQLQFNDKNKLGVFEEILTWKPNSLERLVRRRIEDATKGNDSLDEILEPNAFIERVPLFRYLLKRTMLRPRDILNFLDKCQLEASSAGKDVAGPKEVQSAEVLYSRSLRQEILDEQIGSMQPEDFYGLEQTIKTIGKASFNYRDWSAAFQQVRGLKAARLDARAHLEVLYKLGMVGEWIVGGESKGSRHVFSYEDPVLSPKFDSSVILHPGLREYYSLKYNKELQAYDQLENGLYSK